MRSKIVCWEIEQEFLLFGRHSMGLSDGEGLEPLKQVLQLFNRVSSSRSYLSE